MDVALDGGQDQARLALCFGGRAGGGLLGPDIRLEHGHGLLHHPRALDDLGQEHLARAKQIADDVHSGHERALDDGQGLAVFLAGFLDILIDVVDDAADQGDLQPALD